ncbi:hypothetical protein DPMN_171727 [Dreissena polymorpha]|uniref:Uncharacterized protein n=1 Tax=Dreissena polymorpha TaxID=45954 RepID=A0A9D4E0Y9_DREPO|nr:hypothetical protein DPMN_171727 [Dreissena polymorpha]
MAQYAATAHWLVFSWMERSKRGINVLPRKIPWSEWDLNQGPSGSKTSILPLPQSRG